METQDSETAGLVSFLSLSLSFLKIKLLLFLSISLCYDSKLCIISFPGGEVTFDLKNDAPTLTGARATFTINLNFPPNQTVLSDGEVVWARNCTINGEFAFLRFPTVTDKLV